MRYFSLAARVIVLGGVVVLLAEPNNFERFYMQLLRVSVLIILIMEITKFFVKQVIVSDNISAGLKNLSPAVFMCIVFLLFLEAVFTFIPRSHGIGYTYAGKNWFNYYWTKNSAGYRDKPVNDIDLSKPRILVVGDSFTAGHGIEHFTDTYPWQLGGVVGDRFEVLNLGKNNADTRVEFANLLDYPHRPSILVVQYYGNDIQSAAEEAGLRFSGFRPYSDLSKPARILVKSSYLLNYLYWLFPRDDASHYLDYLHAAYGHEGALANHRSDLNRFVTYSKSCDVPLLVVMMPFLRDLEGSQFFIDPVTEIFQSAGVPVMNVADLVRDIPPLERVVNSSDGHASDLVHARMAEFIGTDLSRRGWLDQDGHAAQVSKVSQCRSNL